MLTIWKYPLNATQDFLLLPRGAIPLTVQIQRGYPVLWVRVDPNAEVATYPLFFRVTGDNPFDEEIGTYVGTFQISKFGLVFHVFLGEPKPC